MDFDGRSAYRWRLKMTESQKDGARNLFSTHPVVLRRGGRVPEAAGLVRKWFDQFTDRAYQIVRRFAPADHFYIDFVASNRPGAFAFSKQNFNFIAIHTGFVEMTWLFNVLMSSPNVLRRIGNSAAEIPHANVDLSNVRMADRTTFRKPFDPVRAAYAEQLYSYTFDFLIAHGHLKFIEANAPLSPLTSHALENDADHFAINTIINEAIDFIQCTKLPDEVAQIYSSPSKGIFLPLFAIAILYRVQWLDDLTFWHLDEPEASHPSHPPIQIRSLGLFSAATLRIRNDIFLPSIRKTANRVVTMAGLHAEFALQKVRNRTPAVPDGFWAIGHPSSYAYMDRVTSRWNEVRDGLQKFSSLPLPTVYSAKWAP